MSRRDAVDVFILQETFLPEGSTTTIPGYRAYHCPRSQGAGGGLSILARHRLDTRLVPDPLSCGEGVEVMAVSLHMPHATLLLYNVYRPPQGSLDMVEVFGLAATETMLVMGDFNAHHPRLGSATVNVAGRSLLADFDECGEVRLLNDTQCPTHVHLGRLDLAFASSSLLPPPTWSLHQTLTSDHFGVLLDVPLRAVPPPASPPRFNMNRADWASFKDIADTLLGAADLNLPLDERAELLQSLIIQAAHHAIPVVKPHARNYRDAWIYGPRVKELNRRVNAARKNLRRSPSTAAHQYLSSVVNHAREEKARLREKAWFDWCRSAGAHTSLGEMWRVVRAMYHPRPTPPPTHPEPFKEAERLAQGFAERTSPSRLPPETQRMQADLEEARAATVAAACEEEAGSDAPFTSTELDAALSHRSDTAPGLDKVTYSMLSHLGVVGKEALLLLINQSFEAGTPPTSWKDATIAPIPKPKDPGAMRPISLLSCPGKVMERMVLARLQWQVGEFPPHMFAFQSRRSTTTCLLTLLGALRSHSGLVVFLDLEKAFELASPSAILEALAERGVAGKLLGWLTGYLSGRRARVRFQGHLSNLHPHTLGTPQGSCISPFLFNILMGQLFTVNYGHGVQLLCYADDLALFVPRHCHETRAQRALDLLQQRCVTLGLKINPTKTRVMTFGLPPLAQPLRLGDTDVAQVTTHQYLGVWLDSSLTFKTQIRYLRDRTTKRLQVLRWMSGRGAGASVTVKRKIYVAAIRSVIDYCAPCLPGISLVRLQSLEVVQNNAMRTILGAPIWTSVATMREECGFSSVRHRIMARTATALATYLRRWSHTSLGRQFRQAFQRPLAPALDGDWVHAVADAVRTLSVTDVALCDPDLPLPDHLPSPPWAPVHCNFTLPRYSHPKSLLPARLQQEALELVASCTSPDARHYYTDGSVGEDGAAGAAFVSGDYISSHKLPPYTTAFQAELTAILLAFMDAYEGDATVIHLFTDSLSAIQVLRSNSPRDNVQLVSAIHYYLALLYRRGANTNMHWIPGHVGVSGNEKADSAARLAGTGPRVTFSILRSAASTRRVVDKAANTATQNTFVTVLEEGSHSALWYVTATGRTRLSLPSRVPSKVATDIIRLRLGYLCSNHIFEEDLRSCAHCLEVEDNPLHHYLLRCPVTRALRHQDVPLEHSSVERAAQIISDATLPTLLEVVQHYPPPT